MGRLIFVKFKNKEEASKFTAEVIFNAIGWIRNDEKFVFGTATGQTPVLTYKELAKLADENAWYQIACQNVTFRQLDNYISEAKEDGGLPDYSYQLELARSIWKVPAAERLIPNELAPYPEEEAKRYSDVIEITNKGAFVLQLLGIGDEDGHIAFNMPGTSFDSKVHVVDLNNETIQSNADKFFGGDTSKVPKRAITMGIGDVLKSNGIILEAFGSKKANIIWKSFFTRPTTEIPASALQTFNGTVLVILDEEAASIVTEKEGEDVYFVPNMKQVREFTRDAFFDDRS